MNQDLPPPPWELRPWYYRNLFLVAAFVLWPAWSVLIIRSPWHNGILSGGVAWAALIVGSVAVFKTIQADGWDIIVLLLPPGLVLTLVLQVFWEGYKRQELRPYLQQTGDDAPADSTPGPSPSESTPRSRMRRRRSTRRAPRR